MPVISFISLQAAPAPAGTSEKIGPDPIVQVRSIIFKAALGNQGDIYIGNDGTNSVDSTTGFPLAPGEVLTITQEQIGRGDSRYDLATMHAVTEVAGDKLFCLWLKTD